MKRLRSRLQELLNETKIFCRLCRLGMGSDRAKRWAKIIGRIAGPIIYGRMGMESKNTKDWWKSTGVIGGLAATVAGVLALFGFDVPPDLVTMLIQKLICLGSTVGGIVAIIGRLKANTIIGKPPVPMVSILDHTAEMDRLGGVVVDLKRRLEEAMAALNSQPVQLVAAPVAPEAAADIASPPLAPQDPAAAPPSPEAAAGVPGIAAPVLAALALTGLLTFGAVACAPLAAANSTGCPDAARLDSAQQYLDASIARLEADYALVKQAVPAQVAPVAADIEDNLYLAKGAAAIYRESGSVCQNSQGNFDTAKEVFAAVLKVAAPIAIQAGLSAFGVGL